MFELYALIPGLLAIMYSLHWFSYSYIKNNIIKSRRWCLNLCCGKTDGGGINADIIRHTDVPRFNKISDIYKLPYKDGQFEWVLCSHTVEHVEDPAMLDRELRRVGKNVIYVLPPLWDIGAMLNILEHRWIFLTLRKTHNKLPRHVKLPGSCTIQRLLGQIIKA